jgi:calcineurin-like phosphoesterase family protein/PASTA domain-containing protein
MRRFSFLIAAAACAFLAAPIVVAGPNPLGFDSPPPPPPVTLLAAGDIAGCDWGEDEATAALLEAREGTVATLGDNVYEDGTPQEFANCYEPSWGRVKARTRPAPGNHDYDTPNAAGYFGYFGPAAGEPSRGYYSYELGVWHVVVLNSNCAAVGGCGPGSPQEQWLRADLAASAAECTLAYWHHPRYSSGPHGSDAGVAAFWTALYEDGAELVLNGHDHDYERFAPQTPTGAVDRGFGIREFVVGTGGGLLEPRTSWAGASEVFDSSSHGILELTLAEGSYAWQFVHAPQTSFNDAGSDPCHGPSPSQPPTPPPPPSPPAPPPPPLPRPACHVPRLIGRTLPSARNALTRAKCRVGRIRYVRARARRGRVVAQSVYPGRHLPVGARIWLSISRGRR